jgi:hypothetical protein
MIVTALTEMFGLQHPIVLGGVSGDAWRQLFRTPAGWGWSAEVTGTPPAAHGVASSEERDPAALGCRINHMVCGSQRC